MSEAGGDGEGAIEVEGERRGDGSEIMFGDKQHTYG